MGEDKQIEYTEGTGVGEKQHAAGVATFESVATPRATE